MIKIIAPTTGAAITYQGTSGLLSNVKNLLSTNSLCQKDTIL